VHGNMGTGLWADHNNAEFLFENNYIEENDGIGLFYEVSYNFMIKNNTFKRNALVDGLNRASNNNSFPSAAVYISESGGDSRAGTQYVQSEITGNLFEDNWDGVALWENADRFCRPGEEFDTTNGCPFFDQTWGLRYKTQNVAVHDNKFSVDREEIGCTNSYCARNAVFSNYGTYPSTSPYLGDVIQQAITFDQNNEWYDNAYYGDWGFMPHDMGTWVNFTTWQGSPYNQDSGSTYDGDPGLPGPAPNNPPQTPVVSNDLDTDTATLEGSKGVWHDWYSATATQSSDTAHGGSKSLRVDVTDPWGWGVQTSSWPSFDATEGLKTLSLWGKLGSGTNLQPKLMVKWLDTNNDVLQTDEVVLPTLTTQWQNAKTVVDAPAGTVAMLVTLRGSGTPGDYLYLDDMVVGDAPNLLDAESAKFENNLGQWGGWYGADTTQSTTEARFGTGSMKVEVNALWGWALQTGNWPGFAATEGDKRVSFWAKQGVGSISNVTLRIKWFDDSQALLQTDTVPMTSLSSSWQRQTATLTPPTGTASAFVEMYSTSGAVGDSIYIDDIVVTNAS